MHCENKNDKLAQVIILLGQSNMSGFSFSKYLFASCPDKYNKYVKGFDDIKISFYSSDNNSSNGKYVATKLGLGLSKEQFGPEVGIAEKLTEANKKNIFLIKYAKGSTTLCLNWLSPSSKGYSFIGDMYKEAVKFIRNSLDELAKNGFIPIIRSICWMQGEDDAKSSEFNNYYIYTKHLISDLRNEFKKYASNGIGFIDAAIANITDWKEHDIINNAKRQNSKEDELSIFIDTNENGIISSNEPDNYHYDSDSMIKLGYLFGEELLKNFIE